MLHGAIYETRVFKGRGLRINILFSSRPLLRWQIRPARFDTVTSLAFPRVHGSHDSFAEFAIPSKERTSLVIESENLSLFLSSSLKAVAEDRE